MPKEIKEAKPEENPEQNLANKIQDRGQTDKAEPKTKKLSILLREKHQRYPQRARRRAIPSAL